MTEPGGEADPDEVEDGNLALLRRLKDEGASNLYLIENQRLRDENAKAARRLEALERKKKAEAEARRLNPRLDDFHCYTEAELETLPYEPPNWLVPELIHSGLWLFSAQPKIGKSFLMTALCRAVATGTTFASWKQPLQGNVLYLDLEGTVSRAQTRQRMIRGDWAHGVDAFRTMFEFPPMDSGGIEDLEQAIANWQPKLIVIDVWADFRPQPLKSETAYAYDRRTTLPLKDMAKRHRITIILVHHNRKQDSRRQDGDHMQEASGSTGLTAGPDGTMTILRGRGEEDAILHVTGRDMPSEQKLAMRFAGGLWTIHGPADEYFQSRHRQTIHSWMSQPANAQRQIQFKEIIEETEIPGPHANRALRAMVKDGTVLKVRRGVYQLPPHIG